MFRVAPYYILAFETHYSGDISTGRCSYSLYTIQICPWKEGHSYVFSRWISSYLLPIPRDIYYSGSHCTHQSYSSGPFDNPLRYNSAAIDAPQSPLVYVCLDWHSSNSFLKSILTLSTLLCWDKHTPIPCVIIGSPLFHSTLCTSCSLLLSMGWEHLNSIWCCSVWIVTPIFHPALLTLHSIWCSSACIGGPQLLGLLKLYLVLINIIPRF